MTREPTTQPTDTVHAVTRGMASLVALCCIAAVGCSDNQNPVTTSTIEAREPITAPPSTDAPVETTTSEPTPESTTTEPAPSTAVETTTTTTTEPAPITTTLEDLLLEIEQDLNDREQAYLQAAADPASPEVEALLAVHNGGPILDRLVEIMAELVGAGSKLRPSPVVPNQVEVLEVVRAEFGTATVMICRIDAAVEFIPGPTAEDAETIVDARVGRFFTTNEMVLVEGVWTMTTGETTDSSFGDESCDR